MKDQVNEIWRAVPNHERYEVSNTGLLKIKNYKRTGKDMIKESNSLTSNIDGYRVFGSGREQLRFHICVAKAFPEICGEWFYGAVVHHIDRQRDNNIPSNLQVMTPTEHASLHANDEKNKNKIRELLKNRQLSEETLRKMSLAKKGKKSWITGKKHTEDSKLKMSLTKKGKRMGKESIHSNKVIQIKDGKIINIFNGAAEAARMMGKKSSCGKCINAVCEGKKKSYLSFQWEYKKED